MTIERWQGITTRLAVYRGVGRLSLSQRLRNLLVRVNHVQRVTAGVAVYAWSRRRRVRTTFAHRFLVVLTMIVGDRLLSVLFFSPHENRGRVARVNGHCTFSLFTAGKGFVRVVRVTIVMPKLAFGRNNRMFVRTFKHTANNGYRIGAAHLQRVAGRVIYHSATRFLMVFNGSWFRLGTLFCLGGFYAGTT